MSEVSFKPIGIDRARLFALMQENKLDGIFLSSPENVFYATGYPCLPGSGNRSSMPPQPEPLFRLCRE